MGGKFTYCYLINNDLKQRLLIQKDFKLNESYVTIHYHDNFLSLLIVRICTNIARGRTMLTNVKREVDYNILFFNALRLMA